MHAQPLTFRQFAERHPNFPVRKLRWIDFRSKDKTDPHYARFAPAFRRVGRNVYIDENGFFSILSAE